MTTPEEKRYGPSADFQQYGVFIPNGATTPPDAPVYVRSASALFGGPSYAPASPAELADAAAWLRVPRAIEIQVERLDLHGHACPTCGIARCASCGDCFTPRNGERECSRNCWADIHGEYDEEPGPDWAEAEECDDDDEG